MGLHDISAGLGNPMRRLVHNNKSTSKVQLSVAPGDELVVSDDLAAQLERTGSFDPVEEPGAVRETIEGALAAEKAAADAAEAERSAPTEPAAPVADAEPEKPRKRAVKKAPAEKADE